MEVSRVVFVIGALTETVPAGEPVDELCVRFRQIAKEIADSVIPIQLSRNGNYMARLLASEILRNTLHGSETIIEIERLNNNDFELTTLNHHGTDRLTSQYFPSVEAEMPHQGKILIERIAGNGNHTCCDNGETVLTRTRFDQQAIMSVSGGSSRRAAVA
jgi:hypothetical protein